MTSVRQGFKFCFENKFKSGGEGKDDEWLAPPPGAYISSTSARNTTTIRATGVKSWETSASGTFNGSWEMSFMLDYHYLEPLVFILEEVNGKVYGDDGFGDGNPEGPIDEKDLSKGYKYSYEFKKTNNTRIPSFCIRRKILNRIAGGPDGSDETTELYGCIIQNVSFSRSATTSQMQVTMSGVYADEKMILENLDSTDYEPKSGELAEYSCVLIGNSSDDDVDDATYIANNESLSISIQTNSGMAGNLCNAFPEAYYEGNVHYQISLAVYSNNPEVYKTRVYSGGFSVNERRPMSKGLLPIPKLFIAMYDGEVNRDDPKDNPIVTAYTSSTNSILFDISDAIVKSMKWQNGEGSKLVDNMSSVDCKNITLKVITDRPNLLGCDKRIGFDFNGKRYVMKDPVPVTNVFEVTLTATVAITAEQIAQVATDTAGYTYVPAETVVAPDAKKKTIADHVSLAVVKGVTLTTDVSSNTPRIMISGTPAAQGEGRYALFKADGSTLVVSVLKITVGAAPAPSA